MMYGNLMDSQVGRAQDFVKRGSFTVSVSGIHQLHMKTGHGIW